MRSRSSSPMDSDMPKHIISKTGFQKDLKPAIEEEKNSQGSGRNESESVESENEESENSNESNQDLNTVLNDENEKDEQESHIQLKQSEIREKLNSYFRAGVSASELIKKNVPGLNSRTIYNHYKLLNAKRTNSRKRGSGRPSLITKKVGTKIESLIKEDDLLELKEIKQILKDKNRLVLSTRTIRRYLKSKGYTHDMPIERHELTQKQKEDRLKFCKEYIDHDFTSTVFIDETLFRAGSAKQRKWRKKGEKHGVSYHKYGKKINAWAGISISGKTSIYLFSENMTKELYVKIMEKHLKEMEWIAGKKFELICDNDPKHTSNLAKDFYKNNCIRIDWPAYSPDLNPIENIWSIMKAK